MRPCSTYLLALVLLFSSWTVFAQVTGWDAALDRYERICEQCIELRQSSAAGNAVSADSVTELLGQLASLRNTLQQAAGRMTPSQRARFESIRLRYAAASDLPLAASSSRPLRYFQPPLVSPSDLPSLSVSRPAEQGASLVLSTVAIRPSAIPALRVPDARHSALHFGVVGFASMPFLSPGLMARLDIGRSGVYLKGSFLPVPDFSYRCKSDGTTSSGFIWTSGEEKTGAFSFSLGSSYAIFSRSRRDISYYGSGGLSGDRLFPAPFALRSFAGVGYGSCSVLWEDLSGRWAQVSDLSHSGFSADAGLLFDIGQLSLMCGLSTIAFQTLSLELGLGFLF